MGARPPRWRAVAAAACAEAILAIGLILGLAAPATFRQPLAALTAISLTREIPPEPRHHPGGAAGKPARALPVEAPEPRFVIARPSPVAVHVGPGAESAGGGSTMGSGSGAGGSGTGSGSGDDEGTEPEWTAGQIRDSDYPHDSREARETGVTRTRIAVDARGRVSACTVIASSGSPRLDEATCRLVRKRFRFSPARDAAGQAVSGSVDYDQEWRITGYMGD